MKQASPFVKTYPGDTQGVDRNVRALTQVVPALDGRVKQLESELAELRAAVVAIQQSFEGKTVLVDG